MAPAHAINYHKLRVRDVGNGATAIIGTSQYASFSSDKDNSDNDATLVGYVDISAPTTYELQHYCSLSLGVDRFGVATNAGEPEVYATIVIQRLP